LECIFVGELVNDCKESIKSSGLQTETTATRATTTRLEIMKRIYREYLEGENYKEISAGLKADGILTAAGNPRWHASTLKKIMTNEK